MRKLEYRTFEVKSIAFNKVTDELFIEGYAAMFSNEDSPQWTWHAELKDIVIASDIIVSGAFAKTLSERKTRIAFCKNHNIDDAKGKIIEILEDAKGLFVKIRISDAEPELKTKIIEEIYTEFSIGFQTIKAKFDKKKDGTYIRHLIEVKLYEVSIVTVARNENTKITDIKGIIGAVDIIDSLIDKENNEEKKYKLMQLKSLMIDEPIKITPLVEPKRATVNFDKMNFLKN